MIASYASELDFVETINEATKNICENMGIKVQTPQYVEKHEIKNEEIAFEIPAKDEDLSTAENLTPEPQELKSNGLPRDIAEMGGNKISDSSGHGFEEFKSVEFSEDDKQAIETEKKAYSEEEESKRH